MGAGSRRLLALASAMLLLRALIILMD